MFHLLRPKRSTNFSRRLKIIELFKGKEVTVKVIVDSINKEFKESVSDKTIERDLKEFRKSGIASKVKHGYWTIQK